ncbi:MAG: magnesium chelatase [Bacillota bacterium]
MSTRVPIRHNGNESLFLAIQISLISTAAGIPLHIHAEGLRGTGKTTVMRWARQLAPSIQRVENCIYQCRPESPHCPIHSLSTEITPARCEAAPMPFVEIGHGAKLGTILGSVDLAKLTDPKNSQAALLPGSIPMANRGIIFIDEINRLAETAPEITDVLLAVMGTKPGKVKIEEVGLMPWEIEVTSSVWAASNPDEDPGPLEEVRRQLSDRFDIVVPVQRPSDPLIVERLLWGNYQGITGDLMGPAEIREKALNLGNISVPQTIIRYIAHLYVEKNIESLRAVESLELSSRLLAAIRGKTEVSFDELVTVLPLVLRHRVEPMALSEILKDLEMRKAASVQVDSGPEPTDDAKGPEQTEFPTAGTDNDKSQDKEPEKSGLSFPHSGREQIAQRFKPGQQPEYQPGDNGQQRVNWFNRILSRYQKATGRLQNMPGNRGLSSAGESGKIHPMPNQSSVKQKGRGANEQPENPARAVPVSPPDPARRIGYLTWEEVLLPSTWEDSIR